MINSKKLDIDALQSLSQTDWNWMLGEGKLPYVLNEMVKVSEEEAEAYYEAVNELYDMFVQAGQYVIDTESYELLGIPESLIPLIEYSWENDNHWHLYGRFDLAGGLAGQPIKLIEFNADTATCIPETAIMQWAMLKANGLEETKQFNTLYESLVEQFNQLAELNPEKERCLLVSTLEGYPEDDTNMVILSEAASDAGFEVDFQHIEKVVFSAKEGIFKVNEDGTYTRFDFWFKLVPWEYIAWDEPQLTSILTNLVCSDKTIVLNPAYVMLFQSKAILKVLWDLFPNHPLLLACDDKPLLDTQCVEKVLFGREGANVKILDATGETHEAKEGEYAKQRKVYQKYVPFLQDELGSYYQAGVFFAGEACGLGFRKGGKILDNQAQFCGHFIA